MPIALHQPQRSDQERDSGYDTARGFKRASALRAHHGRARGHGVTETIGIEKLRSEDSIRRAFANQDEEKLTLWMDGQTGKTFDALLEQEWVLDLDATVKTLYGKQEEATVGYNPAKPGRPSHVYQVMVLAAASWF